MGCQEAYEIQLGQIPSPAPGKEDPPAMTGWGLTGLGADLLRRT